MPARDRFEVRIPFARMLVGLLIVLIPVCLAGLFGITRTDRALQETIGNHFKTIAEANAGAIAQFMSDRVTGVGQIATDLAVVEAAAASNRAYQGMNEAAIAAKIEKTDKEWNSAAAEPLVRQMLSSTASRVLRRHREIDPRITRITVTDVRGATVAATHKTMDYYQADEEYWQNIHAEGRGAVSVTEVLFDEASQAHYIGVGVPVFEENTNKLIGTLDALVDISSLFPIISRVQLGRTSRTLLVRDDGVIVVAPQVNLAMKAKSDEFLAVKEALEARPGSAAGYLVADMPGSGRSVIGYADASLGGERPKLNWMVLVSQDASEALAPVRFVNRLIAFMSLLGLTLLTLLCVYFMLHRKVTLTDIATPEPKQAAF